MTQNLNLNTLLCLLIKGISNSAPQILSLNDEYTFCFLIIVLIIIVLIIIGLSNCSANYHVWWKTQARRAKSEFCF